MPGICGGGAAMFIKACVIWSRWPFWAGLR
jgi:hypothetical protein